MAVPADRKSEIHCPACDYRPRPEDRWECLPRCGTLWNTFWTGGVCPGCGVRWPTTQCPACSKVSPHAAWYHDPLDAPAVEQAHPLEKSGT